MCNSNSWTTTTIKIIDVITSGWLQELYLGPDKVIEGSWNFVWVDTKHSATEGKEGRPSHIYSISPAAHREISSKGKWFPTSLARREEKWWCVRGRQQHRGKRWGQDDIGTGWLFWCMDISYTYYSSSIKSHIWAIYVVLQIRGNLRIFLPNHTRYWHFSLLAIIFIAAYGYSVYNVLIK